MLTKKRQVHDYAKRRVQVTGKKTRLALTMGLGQKEPKLNRYVGPRKLGGRF